MWEGVCDVGSGSDPCGGNVSMVNGHCRCDKHGGIRAANEAWLGTFRELCRCGSSFGEHGFQPPHSIARKCTGFARTSLDGAAGKECE